jgi:uncharacterized membrane protein
MLMSISLANWNVLSVYLIISLRMPSSPQAFLGLSCSLFKVIGESSEFWSLIVDSKGCILSCSLFKVIGESSGFWSLIVDSKGCILSCSSFKVIGESSGFWSLIVDSKGCISLAAHSSLSISLSPSAVAHWPAHTPRNAQRQTHIPGGEEWLQLWSVFGRREGWVV